MTTELVRTERLVSNFEEATRAAKAMALSGYFADAKDISQAMVKVLAGHEMGFGPFASMTGIHVIKGKPSIGTNLMASAVKAHPRYDYKIVTLTPIICEIDFFEDGQLIARSDFTIAEAKKAGVGSAQPPGKPGTMLEMHPRNMLFARAMSNGVRWFTPDVFAGNAVYTPDELGDVVEGAVVEIEPEPETPQEEVAATPALRNTPGQLREKMRTNIEAKRAKAFAYNDPEHPVGNYQKAIISNLEGCFAGDRDAGTKRHGITWYLTGKESSKDLDDAETAVLHTWLNARKGDDDQWYVDEDACREAHAVYTEALREMGQTGLFDGTDNERPF